MAVSKPAAPYVGDVRVFHPTGYAAPYYAGAVRREGALRALVICRHQHDTSDAAQACADNLAHLRNNQ